MKCEYCRRISNREECPSCGAPMPRQSWTAPVVYMGGISAKDAAVALNNIGVVMRNAGVSLRQMGLSAGKIDCSGITAGRI
jgi:RNA polymerase subunit RPABC4/transcription elongation factor Spt4